MEVLRLDPGTEELRDKVNVELSPKLCQQFLLDAPVYAGSRISKPGLS